MRSSRISIHALEASLRRIKLQLTSPANGVMFTLPPTRVGAAVTPPGAAVRDRCIAA